MRKLKSVKFSDKSAWSV